MKYFRNTNFLFLVLVVALLLPNARAQADMPAQGTKPNTPIEHFIVLMQENHTFDNYFGTYPGADGIPEGVCMRVDPFDAANTECIEPFHIGDRASEDLDHSLPTFNMQFNEGKMDGFVYALYKRNQNGAMAMAYYDDRELPYYWNLADEYVLFDKFFTSDHGGSFANHIYWVTGERGGNGVSQKGFPNLVTIFDRLQEKGISWKFYVQNYDPYINYRTAHLIVGNRASQVIWVPLLNIPRFLDDPELSSHIVDMNEYYTDLENGTLPAVAYIVPAGASEHPPGSVRSGQKFVKGLIQALMRSNVWDTSAFLLVYDDWGGWYDHVTPPQVDEHGYGLRVPAIMVSPYSKRGHIDSTVLDFTSILKFIETNWDLEPLSKRDAKANNLVSAFDFSMPPREAVFMPFDRVVQEQRVEPRRYVIFAAYGAALVVAVLMLAWTAFGSDLRRKLVAYLKRRTQSEETLP
jgi:phospholipase C